MSDNFENSVWRRNMEKGPKPHNEISASRLKTRMNGSPDITNKIDKWNDIPHLSHSSL